VILTLESYDIFLAELLLTDSYIGSASAPSEGIDPQPDADLNDGNSIRAPLQRLLPVSQGKNT
jgi:hypothetical protein